MKRLGLKLTTAALFVALFAMIASACTGGGESKTESSDTPVTEDVQESVEESFLEREEDCNLLTLYFSGSAKIETSDVWIWWEGQEGSGHLFTPCAYGMKCQVNVPKEIAEVGFIVRTGCSDPGGSSWGEATKDYDEDRFAVMRGEDTVIYLKSGDGKQYESSDGGKTLEEIRVFKMAAMVSEREIRYTVSPALRIESLDEISVTSEGETFEIEKLSSLNNKVIMGTITMKEPLDITKQYELTISSFGTAKVIPTEIFDSDAFKEAYLYDGDDLGATIRDDGTVSFAVWAPTASKVVLNLFSDGDTDSKTGEQEMERTEKGVWRATAEGGAGVYYTYSVTTALGTQEAVDPYAYAVGLNGNRGMVVDLDSTDPASFENDTYVDTLQSYEDAIIYEVHVRDFSVGNAQSQYPGKYLAFTETGLLNESGVSIGIDYVRKLGVTHIHLQPVYDFATVDEAQSDSFNWGYDPKNYNAPEGSYSTDPYHGEVRISEFKQMVQALHANGLGLIMDMVYNHTYDGNSNFNRIVPYYYYRYTATGANSNGSGCGNETASEREMFRKYMVDSVTYWAKEYHVDGFRFDLMALHDVDTMQEIERAVHAVNPKAILYGEGWTGGTTTLRENLQMTQQNASKVVASEGAIGAVSVFNDAIRDGLKGSVFDAKDKGYINGTVTKNMAYKVIFGLTGGKKNLAVNFEAAPGAIINYMSCHDNLTLYDKLVLSCPDASEEEILVMNELGAAAVFFAKGTPFFLAGEEALRTKQFDSNSYSSSDEINKIDWEALRDGTAGYRLLLYYKELIKVRRENEFLRNSEVSCVILDDLSIEAIYEQDGVPVGYLILNPNAAETSVTLPEGRYTYLFGDFGETGNEITVAGKHAVLLKAESR